MITVSSFQKEVIKTAKGGKREGSGRPARGYVLKCFRISEENDSEVELLSNLEEFEDRSHVVREAIKLLYNKHF